MKICNGVVGSVTLVTLLQLFPLPLPAAPRPPLWPPLPELVKVTYRASFDEVYFAGISNAVVTIPNYGTFRESWSGYSLERVGVVTPFVISGLGETGQVQVATAQGALRLWFRPYWGSGSGPGIAGRLAELAAVEGSQTAVLWSLQVSADGSALQLVGPGGNGVLLATEIDWAADSWHQLVLNYGTNGTELALDGEMVTKGDATLTVPASVVRLVIGSSFSGELPAGGELDEVVCFGRPLKAAFHYLPFASIAAMGPMSEAELAYRQELLAKWQALKAEKAKEAEESDSGGGMEMLRLGGPSANCVTNGPVYLTNVLANFTTNDGWTVYFDIAGGTNGVVYDIFSTPEFLGNDVTNSVWTWLETGMTCETHYYTNQPTNQVFYILTVPGADRDGDGLYDGWEWKHFGTLEQTASGDFDGDGVSNEDAHTSDDNPNNLRFSIVVTNNYVRTSALPVTLGMVTGKAETMAILVDSTNLQSAVWTTFITNCLVSIAATEGWHDVRFGLRGHCITNEVWRTLRVKYDVTPPVVVLTNPDLNGGNKPLIQLRGYGNELLGTIAYDISNAAGMTTNQVGWVTAQDYTTNGFSFATNHFQCYDVSLADGTNTFSLRISDLAGNTTTTNFAHVLDASGDVTPPLITLKWPQNGQALSGSNFAVNGLIDDPTVTMNAEVIDANGLTNKAAVSVGRSGMFWSEQLPLMAGTNQVHLVATDYKGNSSSTNILLTKSAVTLTVTQVSPEEPWQFRASVTGTIDTAGLDVWVNGTLASVNNGTWQAVSVPLNVNNVQVMLVQAYPTGSNPLTTPSTAELREMSDAPPRVQQTGWYFNQHATATLQDLSSGLFFLET
ncbi:MAG TPA: LamG-like jellyroll fold domain-containing protein, partial [Verrucomicrobiae bacterium]|nr:LamG-like jellyroll fold domain-containing protein [Verrucomicrobiae bacterium]